MAGKHISPIPDSSKPAADSTGTRIPSQEELRALLHYNPETGALKWKPRPATMFANDRDAAKWNARFAGKEAFTSVNSDGYRGGTIWSVKHKAHRIIWMLVYGVAPNQIDHIDGNRINNSISNLRNVSHLENVRNRRFSRANSTGIVGVSFDKRARRFKAYIDNNCIKMHLGSFNSLDDAIAVRKRAEAKLGYHKNHGMAQ